MQNNPESWNLIQTPSLSCSKHRPASADLLEVAALIKCEFATEDILLRNSRAIQCRPMQTLGTSISYPIPSFGIRCIRPEVFGGYCIGKVRLYQPWSSQMLQLQCNALESNAATWNVILAQVIHGKLALTIAESSEAVAMEKWKI